MKKLFFAMALLVAATGASAQDRMTKKARALFDENKIQEAQELLTPVFTNEKTRDFAMAWDLQGDIHQRLFAVELNKAAAGQPLDTTVFVTNLYKCLEAYDKAYEFDTKGTYTLKNKNNLKKFRTYIVYAGQFASNNGKNDEAYQAFDNWLAYPKTYKLVEGEPSVLKDSLVDESMIAFYACLSAYNSKNYAGISKHMEQALGYTKELANVQQLCLVSLLEQGDTAQWISTARKFAKVEGANDAIAQNVLAYYFERSMFDEAMNFADELLTANPNNKIANYTKGLVMFNQGKYAEAIPFYEKTIEIDPMYSDAYYQIGVSYSNQGYAINEAIGEKKLTIAEGQKEIEKVKDMYRKAEPYFLKVRELNPDEPRRWASRLKTIYYILGEKEKEAELDAYMVD